MGNTPISLLGSRISSPPFHRVRDVRVGVALVCSARWAIAVDADRDLYVVDAGNNRILRFPAPFRRPAISPRSRNRSNRVQRYGGRMAGTRRRPSSTLSYSSGNGTFRVSLRSMARATSGYADAGNNRVLRFPLASLGTNAPNGPSADLVLGQVDFVTGTYVNARADKTILTAITSRPALLSIRGGVFSSRNRSHR